MLLLSLTLVATLVACADQGPRPAEIFSSSLETLEKRCEKNKELYDSLMAEAALNRKYEQLSRAQKLEEEAAQIPLCE